MKNKIFALVLSVLLVAPCILRAEEVEITLIEVVGMSPIPGDDPLDGPGQIGIDPVEPTSFHATINGNMLSIFKQNWQIPNAYATVTNAATGNEVLNQQFTTCLQEQITAIGTYILHIQTIFGELIGQFMVQ